MEKTSHTRTQRVRCSISWCVDLKHLDVLEPRTSSCIVSQTRPYYRLSSALTSSPIPFLDNPLFRYIMHASPVQVPVRSDVDAMAHAQKPDFVFRAERTSPFKSAERGVSSVDYWQPRCALSAVVMLDTPCSEVVWRVLAIHCIRQFPLHFPSRASPCAVTFQLESTHSAGKRATCHPHSINDCLSQSIR
jgi:hypothetical protein